MSNDEERKVFESWFISEGLILTDINPYALVAWDAFQAGAEWQRGRDSALVEALEQLLSEVEGFNVSGVYFTEKCLGHKGHILAIAALDTYRAAQEKK